MGSMFRSEEMALYHLFAPREGAYRLVSSLGDLGMLHFLDADPSTPHYNRIYSKQLRRCDELLRQIYEIQNFMEMYGYQHSIGEGNTKDFLNLIDVQKKHRRNQEEHYIDELEAIIPTQLENIKLQSLASQQIRKEMNCAIEEISCLEDIGKDFFEKDINEEAGGQKSVSVVRLLGSIKTTDTMRFYKTLFRASKQNCFVKVQPLTYTIRDRVMDPLNPKNEISKSYFIVAYQSSENKVLDKKIRRIIEAFDCDLFTASSDIENNSSQDRIQNKIEELNRNKELLTLTYKQLDKIFVSFQSQSENISYLEQLRLTLIREKTIYHHINLTKNTGSALKALVWIEKNQENYVLQFLQENQNQNYATAQLYPVPNSEFQLVTQQQKVPTKIQTNEFTGVFQEIVNTYGTPRYMEINPGLFTIITFPFLFGVMFGDIGHGTLLFSFGIYLLIQSSNDSNSNKQNESQLNRCRYLILLMGFFATFCGLIYNDFMSVPLELFGSCYNEKTKKLDKDCVVPFGIDPAWMVSTNSLQFYNSFKMKVAIIIGVSQMTLGVLLKGLNSILSSNMIDFFFEFVPQILFLLSTFGYLVLMIILKWLTPFKAEDAPSILTAMLNFPLKQGKLDPNQPHLLNAIGFSLEDQQLLQQILLVVALLCVPLMLLPKPFLLSMHKKKEGEDEEQKVVANDNHHDLSENLVHQVIESIEFVLGSLSHTASYLRLWALSLAHSQLSKVFFDKSLLSSIENPSIVGLIIGFFIFAVISFGVLMCMDVMECFLHSLRLHWVEFQSKFYKADGILFQPLDFETAINEYSHQH